jgi:hypothetical protein
MKEFFVLAFFDEGHSMVEVSALFVLLPLKKFWLKLVAQTLGFFLIWQTKFNWYSIHLLNHEWHLTILHKLQIRQSLILSPGPPIPTNLLCLPTYSINLCSLSTVCSYSWQFSNLCTLQRKSHLCIPFLGIDGPQSQFPHSRVCERFI